MKSRRDLPIMKQNFAILCVLCAFALTTRAQIPIVSTNLVMIGTTNDTTLNVKAVNNPIVWQGRVYRLPVNGTNFATTNGLAGFARSRSLRGSRVATDELQSLL